MPTSFGQDNHSGSRDQQEDYSKLLQEGDFNLAVLADGMGGYSGGKEASKTVTLEFIRFFMQRKNENNEMIPTLLENATFSANSRLAQARYAGTHTNMGSTLVALVIKGNHAWWISVGDSLLYLWRNGKLYKLNAVHNYHQDLRQKVILKEISAEQARHDPEKEGLTSALMGKRLKHVDVSHFGIELHNNDLLILASDGLETLSIQKTEQIITRHSTSPPDAIAKTLINQVLAANNPHQDNVTVQVAKIEGIPSQEQIPPPPLPPASSQSSRVTKLNHVAILVLGTILAFLILGIVYLLLNSKPPPPIEAPKQALKNSVALSTQQLSTFREDMYSSCEKNFPSYYSKAKKCGHEPQRTSHNQKSICTPPSLKVVKRLCNKIIPEIAIPEEKQKNSDNSLLNKVSSWFGNDS